jgi:hypothetical protein
VHVVKHVPLVGVIFELYKKHNCHYCQRQVHLDVRINVSEENLDYNQAKFAEKDNNLPKEVTNNLLCRSWVEHCTFSLHNTDNSPEDYWHKCEQIPALLHIAGPCIVQPLGLDELLFFLFVGLRCRINFETRIQKSELRFNKLGVMQFDDVFVFSKIVHGLRIVDLILLVEEFLYNEDGEAHYPDDYTWNKHKTSVPLVVFVGAQNFRVIA